MVVRLYVGGLPDDVTQAELMSRFERLLMNQSKITIEAVDMMSNSNASDFAYLQLASANGSADEESAAVASFVKAYHNTKWKGKRLRIEPARPDYLQRLAQEWEEQAKKATTKSKDKLALDLAPLSSSSSSAPSIVLQLKPSKQFRGTKIIFHDQEDLQRRRQSPTLMAITGVAPLTEIPRRDDDNPNRGNDSSQYSETTLLSSPSVDNLSSETSDDDDDDNDNEETSTIKEDAIQASSKWTQKEHHDANVYHPCTIYHPEKGNMDTEQQRSKQSASGHRLGCSASIIVKEPIETMADRRPRDEKKQMMMDLGRQRSSSYASENKYNEDLHAVAVAEVKDHYDHDEGNDTTPSSSMVLPSSIASQSIERSNRTMEMTQTCKNVLLRSHDIEDTLAARKEAANARRLAAIEQRQAWKHAAASLSLSSSFKMTQHHKPDGHPSMVVACNKKITFDEDEDNHRRGGEQDREEPTKKSCIAANEELQQNPLRSTKKRQCLFSEDEDEDDEDSDASSIRAPPEKDLELFRPEFAGVHGKALFQMQQRFGGDRRFRLDHRFLMDEFEDGSTSQPYPKDDGFSKNDKDDDGSTRTTKMTATTTMDKEDTEDEAATYVAEMHRAVDVLSQLFPNMDLEKAKEKIRQNVVAAMHSNRTKGEKVRDSDRSLDMTNKHIRTPVSCG